MCLGNVTTKKPKIAKKDVPCYKIVVEVHGKYYAPYYFMKIETGVEYTCKDFQRKLEEDSHSIDIGYHTICTLEAADRKSKYDRAYRTADIKDDGSYVPGNTILLKATIPQGSKYWYGEYEGILCYCSEKIIYSEL